MKSPVREYRSDGCGWVGLFVLPIGLMVGWDSFWPLTPAMRSTSDLYFALVFFVLGFSVFVHRWGVTLDLKRGRLVRWWGFPVRVLRRSYPLKEFHTVSISRIWDLSGDVGCIAYSIAIEGPRGKIRLPEPSSDLERARAEAAELSKLGRWTVSERIEKR